ncbi:hypothetical protein [Pseudomonas aeruginosa]|uniref:hypothetical protein n=1 Tax=Pseudomonas aeruginosa TaxID=287 RepID=UPI001F115068|nr:hypothetical protein [Pseudomonas aeruginosa]
MTHALFKQIDLTAKLGQDGSSLQAMNALRVIRETVAKHLAGTDGAGEIPLELALLALRTIAEFPCSEQDDLPAANMRQIALAALGGAGANSEPGNPGGEPVSGPGNAGERPYPAPGSGDSELAESLQTLVRWLDRVDIEDGYGGVPVIEAVEVAVNELRRLQAEVAYWQEAAGRSRSDVVAYIAERAKLLEERSATLARVAEFEAQSQHSLSDHAELLQALERTHAGHMVGHDQSDQPKGGYSDGYVNGFGECIKVARKVLAAAPAKAQHSVPDGAADLCRFLAKLYCELDGLRYSTAKLPAEQIADALIFKWPVLQGARNQLNIKRISEQPYDESKLHSAIAAMLAAAPGKEVPQAWLDVQAERRRQVEAEGWTPEHDDEHSHGQMARAAACYALAGSSAPNDGTAALLVSLAWPWDEQWWKPSTARRDMVKACALALAEIERLDRACISQSPQPGATTASS